MHQCQARWITLLSKEFPTLAFHASITNSFGKGALIHLLRQFAKVSISFTMTHIPSCFFHSHLHNTNSHTPLACCSCTVTKSKSGLVVFLVCNELVNKCVALTIQCRLHWLPQRGQKFHYQHSSPKESLQCGPNTWPNQGES